MFTSPQTFGSRRPVSSAYREVGVSTAVEGASPHKLVALLYAALAGEISAARGAIARKDIPEKARAIAHAVRIVEEGLQAPLDHSAGGAVAARLAELYDYLVRRLTHANLKHDDAALLECARLVQSMREAWEGIADQVHTAMPVAA